MTRRRKKSQRDEVTILGGLRPFTDVEVAATRRVVRAHCPREDYALVCEALGLPTDTEEAAS